MIKLEEKKLIKRLLDKENYDAENSIEFLRDSGLVECHEYTAYTYEDRYGNYIGSSEHDDSDELLDAILDDQILDEFLDEYIYEYVNVDDLEQYYAEELSKYEIALRLIEED